MARRKPLRRGSYDARRQTLLANATPFTRCWRCGKLLGEHEPHKNGRPATWHAGHLIDGDANSPLALEGSTCNLRAGGKFGRKVSAREREPRSPNA